MIEEVTRWAGSVGCTLFTVLAREARRGEARLEASSTLKFSVISGSAPECWG